MDFIPLTTAGNPIPLHGLCAFLALGLGAVQFARPKGSRTHRLLGYLWVGMMAVVAISSFFIHELRLIGPFGPIHLLSVFVLWTLWRGLRCARRHQLAAHRRMMIQLYAFSLILAGGFTLLPGRIMHQVFFG